MSRVDAIVVSFNGAQIVHECLAALRNSSVALNIIAVDNNSSDGSATAARDAGADIVLENDLNLGFGAAINRGAKAGSAELLLLVNPDAHVASDTVETLCRHLEEDSRLAAVGPKLEDPDGQLELSVDRTMTLGSDVWFKLVEAAGGEDAPVLGGIVRRRYAESHDAASLTAACLLVRRDAFDQVEGFDEDFFLYAEDVDLCLRLRHCGWKLRYASDTTVRHVGGVASRAHSELSGNAYRHSQRYLYAKHNGALARLALRVYLEVKALTGLLTGSAKGRQLWRWLRAGGPRPGAGR